MASPSFNSKSPTIKRILREASELTSTPSADYHASPASDSNLFEWHFTLRGPPSSAFSSGIYHGRIILPPTYPLRPPSFRFLTPSGRFETNREICLSISGHHEETWQPAWGIRTALVALRAFMETDAKGQVGGLDTSEAERKRYADSSSAWKCPSCGKSNGEILEECAAAAAENAGEESAAKEVEVPKDLVIGSKKDVAGSGETLKPGEDTDAELAEGFVPTVPVAAQSTYPAAQPAQGVPAPTRTVASSSQAQDQTQNRAQQQTMQPLAQIRHLNGQNIRRSTDGVPIWIDRAIAGIVLCLVFMILKILFGL